MQIVCKFFLFMAKMISLINENGEKNQNQKQI